MSCWKRNVGHIKVGSRKKKLFSAINYSSKPDRNPRWVKREAGKRCELMKGGLSGGNKTQRLYNMSEYCVLQHLETIIKLLKLSLKTNSRKKMLWLERHGNTGNLLSAHYFPLFTYFFFNRRGNFHRCRLCVTFFNHLPPSLVSFCLKYFICFHFFTIENIFLQTHQGLFRKATKTRNWVDVNNFTSWIDNMVHLHLSLNFHLGSLNTYKISIW